MSIRQNGKVIAGATQYHPDLFDHKWADHILNDVQWLRADTFSWQSGAIYQAAYNHLASDITGKTLQSETISGTTIQFYLADDGHKICPASEESNVMAIYNATGVAWYYIIDVSNKRFKLPRAKHNKYANSLGVVGNGMTLGLSNGTQNLGLFSSQPASSRVATFATEAYGKNIGVAPGGSTATNSLTYGITTDPTKSGMIAQQEQDTDQYKYLYFYVGNFTQTALENTAGLNASLFNDKADLDLANAVLTSTFAQVLLDAGIDVVVEKQLPTAENNYTWYRKYKSGWVEQGGETTTDGSTQTVNLPIEMSNTSYAVLITMQYDSTSPLYSRNIGTRTTTSFTARCNNTRPFVWQVSGIAAN